MDTSALTASFDALTPAQLRRRGSLKWDLEGQDLIGAWVAEMDLGVAPPVAQALHRAVDQGSLGYMPGSVSRVARAAVARFHARAFGWQVDVDDVSLLPGVLPALHAVIAHHTRPGSAVVVPTPAYMPFLSIPQMLGRRCVQVPARRHRDEQGELVWGLDLEGVEAAMAEGAGLLVLCNPWNPVGRVLSASELDAVASLSSRYGVVVFVDEIHSCLVLDPGRRHVPYASRPGADPALTFTATAVSKGWNVPGLKCAQLIASGAARRQWQDNALTSHLHMEAALPGALATTAALSPQGLAWNEVVRGYVHGTAQMVRQRLQGGAGLEMSRLQGTYLAWLDCSGLGLPAGTSPARHFAREPGVVVSDGAAFGRGYESFCRVNLATGRQVAHELADRLLAAAERAREQG